MPESFLSNTSIITREVCPWHLSGLDRVFFNCFPDLSYLNFNCIVFWVWRKSAHAPCSRYHIGKTHDKWVWIKSYKRPRQNWDYFCQSWCSGSAPLLCKDEGISESVRSVLHYTEDIELQRAWFIKINKKLLRWWRLFHQPRVLPDAFSLVLQWQLGFPGLCCQ